MLNIHLPATSPTFREYQLIHQTQQRQRTVANATPAPIAKSIFRRMAEGLGYAIVVTLLMKILTSSDFDWLEWQGWLLSGKPFVAIMLFGGGTLLVDALGALWSRQQYYRTFQEQKSHQPLSIDVDFIGITVQWPYDWQFLPWSDLTRVQQVGDWLLLYPGPDFCYYLNLRQVPPPHTALDVLALIRQREDRAPAATFAS